MRRLDPRDFELQIDPADWVLGRFTPGQLKDIKNAIINLTTDDLFG